MSTWEVGGNNDEVTPWMAKLLLNFPKEVMRCAGDALENRFDEFWSINKKLMENTDSEAILHIPIRIYEVNQSIWGLFAASV
uniref:Uncharacterized protein n=1 Tax=Parascaris equorum TaxID=6256 RepID=A0A914S3X2_PAREQ